jgi:putative ABC transport system ATP-binding protein
VNSVAGAELITQELVHIYHTDGHDVAALSGVSLTVTPGEVVGLLGPSGSGKSTLLLACAALLRPSAGRLLVDGTNLATLSDPDRDLLRARTIGVVLQGAARNLIGYLTVAENVLLAQRAARVASAVPSELPSVEEVLAVVGLRVDPVVRAEQLTPGRQQLLALACGIAHRPRMLLADEPTSQLDPAARDVVLAALSALNHHWRSTVVLVTHDPAVAAALPRTVTIRDGRIGAEGRRGEEYSVITADGSLTLPADVLATHPPGTLLRIERFGSGLRLYAVESQRTDLDGAGSAAAGDDLTPPR